LKGNRGIDLTGQKFGKITVLHEVERPGWAKDKSIYWLCVCECNPEKEFIIHGIGLRSGKTKSCGCTLSFDLTGKKFNMLQVIDKFGKDKNGKNLWNCICDCGNKTIKETSSLIKGDSKSCGCLKHKKQNLIGQKFGMLTVLERTKVDENRDVFWKCLCECGNTVKVRGRSIKNGATQSCGCLVKIKGLAKAEDLTGQRFGRLVALEYIRKSNKSPSVYWKCRCDCGNEKLISAKNLKCGTMSCGCYKKERVLKSRFLGKSIGAINSLIYVYKRSARNRSLEYNLTKELFLELTQKNCFYCGAIPNNLHKCNKKMDAGDYIYNGIDRVDNSKGYIESNVVTCCYNCNKAKDVRNKEDFINWIMNIYNNMNLKEYSI
jgi:hypothetical protein